MFKRRELTAQIEGLTEEIEELRNDETSLIRGFGKKDAAGMKEVKAEMAESAVKSSSYWEREKKYSRELNQAELIAARTEIRPVKEQAAIQTIQRAIQRKIYPHESQNTAHDVDVMLDEEFLELRYRAEQRRLQRRVKSRNPER